MQSVHTTVDGRQLLILHGDQFDGVIKYAKWLSVLGSAAYECSLVLNRWFNHMRKWMGLSYWSLSAYLKKKAKRAVQYIADFENAVVNEAKKYEVEGVVCGHIHQAEITKLDDILYMNTGDWVESCTALVEHVDGTLEIIRWSNPQNRPERLHVVEPSQMRRTQEISPNPVPASAASVAY